MVCWIVEKLIPDCSATTRQVIFCIKQKQTITNLSQKLCVLYSFIIFRLLDEIHNIFMVFLLHWKAASWVCFSSIQLMLSYVCTIFSCNLGLVYRMLCLLNTRNLPKSQSMRSPGWAISVRTKQWYVWPLWESEMLSMFIKYVYKEWII